MEPHGRLHSSPPEPQLWAAWGRKAGAKPRVPGDLAWELPPPQNHNLAQESLPLQSPLRGVWPRGVGITTIPPEACTEQKLNRHSCVNEGRKACKP